MTPPSPRRSKIRDGVTRASTRTGIAHAPRGPLPPDPQPPNLVVSGSGLKYVPRSSSSCTTPTAATPSSSWRSAARCAPLSPARRPLDRKLIIDGVIARCGAWRPGSRWMAVPGVSSCSSSGRVLGEVRRACRPLLESLLGDLFSTASSAALGCSTPPRHIAQYEDAEPMTISSVRGRQTARRIASHLVARDRPGPGHPGLARRVIFVQFPWLLVLLVLRPAAVFPGETHYAALAIRCCSQWTPERRSSDSPLRRRVRRDGEGISCQPVGLSVGRYAGLSQSLRRQQATGDQA